MKIQSIIIFSALLLALSSVYGQSTLKYSLIKQTAGTANTANKPQSKTWKHDGFWWSVFPNAEGTYIWSLDHGDTWTPVMQLSTAISATADCKRVGDTTYIMLFNGAHSELINTKYNSSNSSYEHLDVNNPATRLSFNSTTETVVIDVDRSNIMWMAYEEDNKIKVNSSIFPYTIWGTPTVLETGVSDDDICSIVALPDKVGVLWSNQNTKLFGFKTHLNGDNQSIWSIDEQPGASQNQANIGEGFADDHINMATTSNGDLFCVVKTSYDNYDNNYPLIGLLKRNSNGTWDNLYYVDSIGTRPLVVIDEGRNILQVIYTEWDRNGPTLFTSGNIIYKESNLSTISFSQRDTLIHSTDYNNTAYKYNNVSSTKDNYDGDLVIIASTQLSPFKIVGIISSCH